MHTAGRHTSHSTARGCRCDWEGVWEWWRGVEAGWCGSNGAAPPPPGTTHSLIPITFSFPHHLMQLPLTPIHPPILFLSPPPPHEQEPCTPTLEHHHKQEPGHSHTLTHSLPPSSHLVHLVSSLTHPTWETQTQQIKVGGGGERHLNSYDVTVRFLRRKPLESLDAHTHTRTHTTLKPRQEGTFFSCRLRYTSVSRVPSTH